ncbi:PCI-domain-containing protein [Lophium mytilinum]|uniref:PCI-domain-containing protein n=1 Tax=Lophium mytilinum TaxID=390894 RepID=A0A6A6R953_9PEZI|nr:PCI-domain-containing protein [Lophium mytilinum]
MATTVEQAPYFLDRKEKNLLIVKDPPKFDLESYIANYEGRTRLKRLEHIAMYSSYLAVDALRMAITEAKQGADENLYLSLTELLQSISREDPLATPDVEWAERTFKANKLKQEQLEGELKAYKNNLIKESIRMGNEDLGHFYYQIGDLGNAFKSYFRMREHCTSAKHLTDMTMRLTFVAIAQRNWLGAQSHATKVDAQVAKNEERGKLEPVINACMGLTHMCGNNFRDAARVFLNVSPSFITSEPVAAINFHKEVLTGNDVAVYGGLCALASMDRTELQERVLSDTDFRQFLELEPHIRRAISAFCSSKYSACLQILEEYRADYLLDIYLGPVVTDIYHRIRTKSIVQYFKPFSCVSLDEMAKKFQVKDEGYPIEDELTSMITGGILNARIDLVEGLLISPAKNPRHVVHSDALKMAQNYDHTLRLRLTRLNMQNAGMEVRAPKVDMEKNMDRGEGFGGTLRRLGQGLGGFS